MVWLFLNSTLGYCPVEQTVVFRRLPGPREVWQTTEDDGLPGSAPQSERYWPKGGLSTSYILDALVGRTPWSARVPLDPPASEARPSRLSRNCCR